MAVWIISCFLVSTCLGTRNLPFSDKFWCSRAAHYVFDLFIQSTGSNIVWHFLLPFVLLSILEYSSPNFLLCVLMLSKRFFRSFTVLVFFFFLIFLHFMESCKLV